MSGTVTVPSLGITKSSANPAVPFIGGLLIEVFVACVCVLFAALQPRMRN